MIAVAGLLPGGGLVFTVLLRLQVQYSFSVLLASNNGSDGRGLRYIKPTDGVGNLLYK